MMREMIILTNNKKLPELESQFRELTVLYRDVSVREILKIAQEKIIAEDLVLLSNPLCGRSARPFPWLSLMLGPADGTDSVAASGGDSVSMWDDMMAFEMMDQKNRAVYEAYSEEILNDCSVLDRDLVESAVRRLADGSASVSSAFI